VFRHRNSLTGANFSSPTEFSCSLHHIASVFLVSQNEWNTKSWILLILKIHVTDIMYSYVT
jgi:hypothetical protein